MPETAAEGPPTAGAQFAALPQNDALPPAAAVLRQREPPETTLSIAPSLPPPLRPEHGMTAELPQAASLDIIFIEGLRGETVIGIHDTELHRPQPLVIDVYAGLPRAAACSSDEIADTIDYSVVRQRLHILLAGHDLKLLEAFAEAVAAMLIDDFGAHWVRVKVVKPRKFDDLEAVGVMIERRRADRQAQPARSATVLSLIGAGMVPPQGR